MWSLRKPEVDLDEVERRVLDYIAQDLPISVYNDHTIVIGQEKLECSGPHSYDINGEDHQFPFRQEFPLFTHLQNLSLGWRAG